MVSLPARIAYTVAGVIVGRWLAFHLVIGWK